MQICYNSNLNGIEEVTAKNCTEWRLGGTAPYVALLLHVLCKFYTVNLEIFGVKIFSDTGKHPTIKNTKISRLGIIGVYNFGQTFASENFFSRKFLTRKFLYTKIFGFTVAIISIWSPTGFMSSVYVP